MKALILAARGSAGGGRGVVASHEHMSSILLPRHGHAVGARMGEPGLLDAMSGMGSSTR